jgi:hypothetical protein
MIATKIACGKNPVPLSSRIRSGKDFFSCFSILECIGTIVKATISHTISRIPAKTSGARISICVSDGSASMNTIDSNDIFPDILDETFLYSSQRPSFSSAHFRNDALVPLEKALSANDIHMPPSVKTTKPSAIR